MNIPAVHISTSSIHSELLEETIRSGWFSSRAPVVSEFEKACEEYLDIPHTAALQSGTAAVHLALLASGVVWNDVVIVPDLTFVASVNAVRYIGAEPLFLDVASEDWQLDLDLLEEFLQRETHQVNDVCVLNSTGQKIRCVLTVDVLGWIGDINRLSAICKTYALTLVEDAAASFGTYREDKPCDHLICYSFNINKVLTTGGGGAVCSSNKKWIEAIKHSSQQSKIPHSDYDHDGLGFNYRMTGLNAALGLANLKSIESDVHLRRENARIYTSFIVKDHEESIGFDLDTWNAWVFPMSFQNKEEAKKLLNRAGIEAHSLWIPMHALAMHKGYRYITNNDVSKTIASRHLLFPTYPGLRKEQLDYIAIKVKEIKDGDF